MNPSRGLRCWMLVIVVCALAAPVLAQEPRLRVGLQVEREVARYDEGGKLVLEREPVENVAAGDVLVYSLQIHNEGDAPAVKAKVVDPIPDNTVLIPDSAVGEGTLITYSIDGGTSYAPYPITRVVTLAGVDEVVPVPVEDYTHVRWTLTEPLAPGQARAAHFKVRVR